MDARTETTPSPSMWAAASESPIALDEDCSPTKSCRNMVDVSFDGFAEPGTDLAAAWRAKLEREGKAGNESGSLRDLVLGDSRG